MIKFYIVRKIRTDTNWTTGVRRLVKLAASGSDVTRLQIAVDLSGLKINVRIKQSSQGHLTVNIFLAA